MLCFEESSKDLIDVELAIYNSNPFFNRVSEDKTVISIEEIQSEMEQAKRIGAHRYLIKDDKEYIGIMEWLLYNPGDQCTWLGLLLIRGDLHSKGYGTRVLNLFYDTVRQYNIDQFRLGVLAENQLALSFWLGKGFEEIGRTTSDENKTIIICEKRLT